jgi:PPP family 3-phenylpropionic acid transporter
LFAFLVLYLKKNGFDEIRIGMIMSAISIASIVGQPFWGHYCDRKNTIRNVLVLCLAFSGIAALLIPVLYQSYLLIVIICLVVSFTENSMPSIIDSWTMSLAIGKPWLDYGLTRGLGSLGYALTAAAFGILLDRFGYGLMFPTHFILILITIGFCFFVDKNSRTGIPEHLLSDRAPVPKIRIKGSGRFIWFLISSTLVFIGFRAAATFYPLLLSQKGGNNSDMGLSLFIMALSEVPVLFLSRRLLLRFKDTALLVVSMFFFVLRIFLHIVMPTIPGLVLIQAMQALSFALFLPASVYYIKRIAPEGLTSTYLTVASSFYFGIGGIIGSMAGGFIINKLGIYSMFWYSTGVTVLGMLIFIASSYKLRQTV